MAFRLILAATLTGLGLGKCRQPAEAHFSTVVFTFLFEFGTGK